MFCFANTNSVWIPNYVCYCCLLHKGLVRYGNYSSLFWPYGPRYAPVSVTCSLIGCALLDLGDADRQRPFCFEIQATIERVHWRLLQRQIQSKFCRVCCNGKIVSSIVQIQPPAPYLLVRSVLHAHLHPECHSAPTGWEIDRINIVCPLDRQHRFCHNIRIPRRFLAISQRRRPGGCCMIPSVSFVVVSTLLCRVCYYDVLFMSLCPLMTCFTQGDLIWWNSLAMYRTDFATSA